VNPSGRPPDSGEPPRRVPVLDIGGTHVTSALVDGGLVIEQHRGRLDSAASSTEMIEMIVATASELRDVDDIIDSDTTWGIAIPGPFRYAEGIGDFRGVDKFHAFHGVDVGSALRSGLPRSPRSLRFINDAEAYAVGEWDAHGRPGRLICITLGTGTGSGFIVAGRPVRTGPQVPLGGDLHTETWLGQPFEDTVSRRAIRERFAERSGIVDDVDGITQRCRAGDPLAREVLDDALGVLGTVLGQWVDRFAADSVVIGGSISHSWDVIGPRLLAALSANCARHPTCGPALLRETAPLIGAAMAAAGTPLNDLVQGSPDDARGREIST